jgi:glucose/arabinose dehydrogenase
VLRNHFSKSPLRWALALAVLAGCSPYKAASSKGGGQIPEARAEEPRRPHALDIAVPDGYRIELVARGLSFPTGVAFDGDGRIYVVESGYSDAAVQTTPRIVEIDPGGDGIIRDVVKGGGHAPWNGIAYADGAFFVAQGGQLDGGRIVRFDARDGTETVLIDALPSLGDHHTDGPLVVGDQVYFGQGTATNSGVVGDDSRGMGWLERHPDFHDIPCKDVKLVGTNFKDADGVETGAYLAHGKKSEPGQIVAGEVPCSGAVMRVPTDGGDVELVAWGFRNPYGLVAAGDGTIYVSDNGYDVRGSRPVFGSGDPLWRLEDGEWYGWPDFVEGRPITDDAFGEAEGDTHGFVLAEHIGKPPSPVAILPVHASADGLDISRSAAFGHVGWLFVAEFGDMAPNVGKVMSPVGYSVVRVDPETGRIEDFARNAHGGAGPASRLGTDGLERPIAVRFDPSGEALYVVDFGVLRMTGDGVDPQPETGALWRITREEASHAD